MGLKLEKVPILNMSWVSFGAMLIVLLVLGGVVNNYGLLGDLQLPSLATAIPASTAVGGAPGTTVSSAPVTTSLQVSTVDIQTSVRETYPDTTGVKNRIGGSVAWYYDGDVTPFETTTLSASAYASSTTDARPGAKVFGVFTNSSYYGMKLANPDGSNIDVPVSPSMSVEGFADLLNTVTVSCQNSTSGTWTSGTLNQTLTTDQAVTLNCKIAGGSARGVFKAPVKVCIDHSTANFSTSGTYVPGAVKGTVPSGVCAGYETAWDTSLSDVTDFNEVPFQLRITPASGINPGSGAITDITLKVVDCGATFTKSAPGVLFSGCENVDTLASIGSTDDTYTITVD